MVEIHFVGFPFRRRRISPRTNLVTLSSFWISLYFIFYLNCETLNTIKQPRQSCCFLCFLWSAFVSLCVPCYKDKSISVVSLVTGIIPILDEVSWQIFDALSVNSQRNVVPGQTCLISSHILLSVISHINEIVNSAVIVLDAWVVSRIIIVNKMSGCIVSAIAQVKASHIG